MSVLNYLQENVKNCTPIQHFASSSGGLPSLGPLARPLIRKFLDPTPINPLHCKIPGTPHVISCLETQSLHGTPHADITLTHDHAIVITRSHRIEGDFHISPFRLTFYVGILRVVKSAQRSRHSCRVFIDPPCVYDTRSEYIDESYL